jgi:hypothetical protein
MPARLWPMTSRLGSLISAVAARACRGLWTSFPLRLLEKTGVAQRQRFRKDSISLPTVLLRHLWAVRPRPPCVWRPSTLLLFDTRETRRIWKSRYQYSSNLNIGQGHTRGKGPGKNTADENLTRSNRYQYSTVSFRSQVSSIRFPCDVLVHFSCTCGGTLCILGVETKTLSVKSAC